MLRRTGNIDRLVNQLSQENKSLRTDVNRLLKDQQATLGGPQAGYGTENPGDGGGSGGGNYYTATLGATLSSGSTASATLKYGPSGAASGSITVEDRESRIPAGSTVTSGSTVDVAKMGDVYQLVGWSCDDMT